VQVLIIELLRRQAACRLRLSKVSAGAGTLTKARVSGPGKGTTLSGSAAGGGVRVKRMLLLEDHLVAFL